MKTYLKQVFNLGTGAWTPIVAPIDCNIFWCSNRDGLAMRENTEDAPTLGSAYDIIKPNQLQFLPQYVMALRGTTSGYWGSSGSWTRFKTGDLITNLMADGTNSIAVVAFIL